MTCTVLWVSVDAAAQTSIERNVVYGMYSGLALLLDVHHADKPNGRGVIFVAGSGWQAPLEYSALGLKDSPGFNPWGPALLRAGYSVFSVNHRAAPRFHYPALLDDVRRAVRFVRANAARYKIDSTHLGGIGASSGGHLIGLVATLQSSGSGDEPDPVDRESSALQAVVLLATPTDLTQLTGVTQQVARSFLGLPYSARNDNRLYTSASPIAHVSSTAPPILLIHGDADEGVPFQQSVAMEAALGAVGVPTKLVRLPGGVHRADLGASEKADKSWPDFLGEMTRWLDAHLKLRPAIAQ
jgi:acetyl esterase/lipase